MTVLAVLRKAGQRVSGRAMEWARKQRAGGPDAKAVLLVLADRADPAGACWPSTRTLADDAEVDQRTIRRLLGKLRDAGLVSWEPGAGRASNRYQLALGTAPVVRHPEASLREPVVRHRTASLRAEINSRSEADDHRSEALDHRSETTRPADQQRSEQNQLQNQLQNQERKQQRASAHPRELVTAAELNATATGPAGYRLVADWAQAHPGVLNPRRRALARAVDELLAQRADPVLVVAALDRAHDDPKWHDPVKALPFAYEDERRAQSAASTPPRVQPAVPGTSSVRAGSILALKRGPSA